MNNNMTKDSSKPMVRDPEFIGIWYVKDDKMYVRPRNQCPEGSQLVVGDNTYTMPPMPEGKKSHPSSGYVLYPEGNFKLYTPQDDDGYLARMHRPWLRLLVKYSRNIEIG